MNLQAIRRRIEKNNNNAAIVYLPDDFSTHLPKEGVEWLKKYGITFGEIHENHVGWSDKFGGLVFPIYGSHGDLLAWQCRGITKEARAKWFSVGDLKNIHHYFGKEDTTIIIVEDLLSAIKCGRIYRSMPLFGSHLSDTNAVRLSRQYPNLIIWLDKDKAKEAVKQSEIVRMFFKSCRVVITDLDPKEYKMEEIRRIIDE